LNWEFIKVIFQAGKAGLGVLSEDPTVWLDGARPPPVSCIVPALA